MSCESLGLVLVYAGILLALTIWSLDDYKFCELQFGWIRVTFVIMSVLFKLSMDIPDRFMICKLLSLTLSLLGLFFWDVLALWFYIANLVVTPRCVNVVSQIIDGIFILLMTVVVTMIIWMIVKETTRWAREKRTKGQFTKALGKIYSKIHTKNLDIEKFIEKWKVEIDSTPLTDQEHAIIQDKFCYYYIPDKVYSPDQCCICYDDFEGDKILFDYPNCKHSYHFDCIGTWLKTKMKCPMCMGPIRASILRSIVGETLPL
jgi:hypothetical protein